jgi:bifunctional non-homologous end joining protein LigD
LRHPSFLGLREDKPAKDVVREMPKPLKSSEKTSERPSAEGFGITISNPDRVIYPEDGITKRDLADYYAAIEPLIMVDAAKRPMTLIRCPQGRAKKCFFQKHDSGTMGEHVLHVPIEEKDGDVQDYLYFDDIRGLLACVQMGTIEFHGWGSKVEKVEFPDRLVFDLDPDVGLDFAKVKAAAVRLRGLLEDLGLKSVPLLTGGKGIHVVVPLNASKDWPAVKSFAERFSRAIAEAEPEMFTANIRKVQRKGRIFLDWLRNQRGATAVMPFSARAREGAPVAAPVGWEELDRYKGGNHFTIRDADELLDRAGSKALAGWGQTKQALPDA